MLIPSSTLSRRGVLIAGLLAPFAPGLALAEPKVLTFAVFRNGTRIGQHQVSFTGDDRALTATTEAVMTVKIGPVPVFKYRHHAVEKRIDGAFSTLETRTSSNGKAERVSARRDGGVVRIEGTGGSIAAPATADPMTHWNPKVFDGPLFNPQTGKMLKVTTSKLAANHWAIRGEAEIDDFYDAAGFWSGLKGKLEDGSRIEYRRL
jgi:hypothetical protein